MNTGICVPFFFKCRAKTIYVFNFDQTYLAIRTFKLYRQDIRSLRHAVSEPPAQNRPEAYQSE